MTLDSGGNIYGTTVDDGAYGFGSVFKLTPVIGGWTYTSLDDFTGGTEGGYPHSNVGFGAAGNLYATAGVGGSSSGICQGLGCGVVREITP